MKQAPEWIFVLLVTAAPLCIAGEPVEPGSDLPGIVVTSTRRLAANPLVHLDTGGQGPSINGPALMRVPDWVADPLGRYYLYYATHRDANNIRLLYADAISGPWKEHADGTLQKEDTIRPFGEPSSPDILIDDKAREILMYFHSGSGNDWPRLSQATGLSISKDGINFHVPTRKELDVEEGLAERAPVIADFYLRVFRWKDRYYGVAKGSESQPSIWQSDDPRKPFDLMGEWPFQVRHMAVLLRGDHLLMFYSSRGDKPERIRLRIVTLAGEFADWKVSQPVDVMYPFTKYEGVEHRMGPGGRAMKINWHGLRDPHVFEEEGRCYLSYSTAGESGIALAEITLSGNGEKPFLALDCDAQPQARIPGQTVTLTATAPHPRFQPKEVEFYAYRTANDPWTKVGTAARAPFSMALKIEAEMEFVVARFRTDDGEIITSMPPVMLLGKPEASSGLPSEIEKEGL